MGLPEIEALAARLTAVARVTVLTGAGVSAASGVPTFRGADGLWKERNVTDLATPEAFARDPEGVWEWYAWRRHQVAACVPNDAHHVLARWSLERRGVTVITQNVDDLHLRAGTRDLLRLHGSLWELSCAARCVDGAVPWVDADSATQDIRRCPHCGAVARPAVVWFGEPLDPGVVARASTATRCDVFITAGTSSVVYPAAGLVHEARRRGAFTVEINIESTPASDLVDLAIAGPLEQVLPEVDRRLVAETGRRR